jgi:hypothetical protein
VHEVLTERRDESVDLGELIERLRAMLVQGLGAGKDVAASLERSRSPATARRRSRSSSRELLQNALEHGGERCAIELAQRNGDVSLAIADDGAGSRRAARHGALDRRRARARRARRHAVAGGRGRAAGRGRLPGLDGPGSADELGVGRLVAGLRRAIFGNRAADEACVLEIT